jgi:sugar lactone lactonase YvrE
VSSERRIIRAAIALPALAVLALAGCGRPPGIVFESRPEPLQWPAPPDHPRIEYVGQLVTSDDLKPGKSFGQLLGESLFGRPPSRSMLSPYAVCTDGAARVFVCDSNAQVVHVFDLDERTYEQWTPEAVSAVFAQPVGIAFDAPARRLLVADSVAGRIFIFLGDGTCVGAIGEGLLQRPTGLAIDPDSGRVFIADTAAHQVVVLDEEGKLLERVGTRGIEPGTFNFPTNLGLDRAGRLYVADTLNHRVQVFDRELKPVAQIGSAGDLPGYFSQPKGVALDSEGHVYVVDAHFESVQIFDGGGQLLMAFGREGAGPGEFWLPAGIHIDPSDRIWIADSYNRRVQVFQYLPEAE